VQELTQEKKTIMRKLVDTMVQYDKETSELFDQDESFNLPPQSQYTHHLHKQHRKVPSGFATERNIDVLRKQKKMRMPMD
jgi:hypothetical protein